MPKSWAGKHSQGILDMFDREKGFPIVVEVWRLTQGRPAQPMCLLAAVFLSPSSALVGHRDVNKQLLAKLYGLYSYAFLMSHN